ncbi:methyl-accepting chemotaxis protein [Uliginosibacterium sp. H3]|uniref:Methyl-accepting chemotaxis protein n=1 Tax=Uliginosibacterium silvisoli TaxID=3114758 RepID=A0ABU6K6H4_9RHOO|nr:methyl-accepting chemotaxis protein [Uliginosibacterium sp. H3]
MSIKQKIWGLVAIALLTCVILVGLGVTGLTRLHTGMTAITVDALPDLQLSSEVRTLYLNMHAIAYGRALSTDEAEGKKIDAELQQFSEKIIGHIQTLRTHTTAPDEVKLLDEATAAITVYLSDMQRVGNLANMGESKMALEIMNGKLKTSHEQASAAFEKLGQINTEKVARVSKDADGVFAASLSFSIVAAVIALGVFAVIGYFLARSIVAPMAAMQKAITTTAESLDFTHPVPVGTHDEIGLTVLAYNGLIKRLRDSFGQVQGAAQQLAGAVGAVDSSSREIAENSRTQSDATASMAAAIEQLTVSISVIVERALDASTHTQNSQKSADRGTEVIMNTVGGIQSIAESVQVASERIVALRSDSESISSVANMIKEIADQTNLLALNAAIEAARAGEQGRGFAVVADEVRKLAERTTLATSDISTLILKIQDAARNAVDSMSSSVDAVERGVENAREAGSAIREIQSGAGMLVELVDEMTDAMREQSSASTIIARQIEQIAQMTERNSSAAQGVASSVENISGMGRGISQTLAAYRV